MTQQLLVPPLNFSLVNPGVYRSGHPNKKNLPFLKKLSLKTMICLTQTEPTEAIQEFVQEQGIQYIRISIQGNKEKPQLSKDKSIPVEESESKSMVMMEMEKDLVCKVLSYILNKSLHPLLIHCDKGKHRVGCVMGILRRMQLWSLTCVLEEYRRFAGDKTRVSDEEFIELFEGPVSFDLAQKPYWMDTV